MASEIESIMGVTIAYCSFIIMSLFAICIGTYQSVKYIKTLKERGEPPEMAPLTVKEALKFPFKSALILVLLYLRIELEEIAKEKNKANLQEDYFLKTVLVFPFVLYLSELIRPVFSFLISPILQDTSYNLCFKKRRGEEEEKYIIDKHFTSHGVACFLTCFIFGGWYLLSKHWITNNILGVGASITVIKHFHLNKMVTGCILLTALLIYDVVFVFGTDLMITVATSLDFPAKLLFPVNVIKEGIYTDKLYILGVGDIVIPGAMIAFLLRFDLSLNRNSKFYFYTSIISYSFGLLTAFVISSLTQRGQPALLYLVPCSVIPPLALAFYRGDGTSLFNFEDHPGVGEEILKIEEEPAESSNSNSSLIDMKKND